MKREVLTRTILETTVTKALHDLETDTNRAIRNLIDLALTFSNGRFQKAFFEAAQKMLKNENSAYYQLARNLVTGFNQETIKTFGINIGYNSCTCGAGKIRENEEKYGFNIPWAIAFGDGPDGTPMEKEVVESGIRQGVLLGVYTYLIFCGEQVPGAYLDLCKRHPDCAFILFLPPSGLSGEEASRMQEIHNVLLSLEAGRRELSQACARLRELGIPYSIHSFYGDAQAEDILNERWIESILPDQPIFAIAFAKYDCGTETRKKVESYVLKARSEQLYPLLMFDAWSDILKIDQIISDDSCFVGFSPDGTLYGASGRLEGHYSLKEMELRKILSETMPKKTKR